jgi:subtilisin family serine protease
VPDEVIVVFKEDVGAPEAEAAIGAVDAVGSETLDTPDAAISELVELPPDVSVIEAISELRSNPDVDYVQPNYIYTLLGALNDPYYNGSYDNRWHLDKINADEAWARLSVPGGKAVRVAVLDTAAQITHEDLAGNIDTGAARDFAWGISEPYPTDGFYDHGTHVMGIIGAVSNNGKGVAGVATGASNSVVEIIPVNVFQGDKTSTTAAVVSAVNYSVSEGAQIINMSLGGPANDTAMKTAIDSAVASGVTVVCAAGNNGTPIPYANYPSGFGSVIGVVNTNQTDARNSTSNYAQDQSAEAHYVSAPGTAITSTITNNQYGSATGTSMAAPVVTGVVAMMLYENPDLTPTEILNILKETSGNKDSSTQNGGKKVDADGAVAAARAKLPAKPLEGNVTVSGTLKYNEQLTANANITSNTPGALSYAWKRGNSAINGATESTYTLTETDIGRSISVTVTAANYGSSLTSEQTAAVEKAAAPTITWPTAASITYGAMLSSSALSGGSSEHGTFAWKDPSVIPTVSNSGYPVTFTPSTETANRYQAISSTEQNVSVTVGKASTSGVNQSVSIIEGKTLQFPLTTLLPGVQGLTNVSYQAAEASDTDNILTVGSVNGAELPLTVSSAAAGKNATVTVTIRSDNYTDFPATVTVTAINKTSVTIGGFTAQNVTYTGAAHIGYTGTASFGGGTPSNQQLTAHYTGTSASGTLYDSAAAPTNAGSYTVTLTLAGDATYYGQWIGTFTIAKADPAYTAPTNLSAEYGQTLADVTPPLTGGFAWNDPSASVGNAGTNNFSAAFTPTDTANYNILASVSIPVAVAEKPLGISPGVTAVNRVYDGTADVALQIGALTGVLPADDGEVGIVVNSAAAANKSAGTDKNVAASLALTGGKAGNYSITQPAGLKVNIVKKQITADDVTLPQPSKTYNGSNAASFTAQLKPGAAVSGDKLTLTLTGTYDSAEIGTGKTVTISGWSLSGADAGNYELSGPHPATATGAITQQPSSGGGGAAAADPTPTPTDTDGADGVTSGAAEVSYTQSGGTVSVSLPDSKVTEIIGKSDGVAAIDLSAASNATTATLPKAALTKLADAELAVEIILPHGSVTLDAEAAASIASQSRDSSVSVALKPVAASSLNERQQNSVGDAPVYDISVSGGSTPITGFDGARVTISLPYTLKAGEKASGIVVWHLDGAGNIQKLETMYDTRTKTVIFTTDHLSLYVIAYEDDSLWANPFTDVSENDWFYDDVRYAHTNSLMTGSDLTRFNPNSSVTRGMIVTILYRLYQSAAYDDPRPDAEDSGFRFIDVVDGLWYSDAVNWAARNGIVTGYENGSFGPNIDVSREQLAVILLRYAIFTGTGPQGTLAVSLDFADTEKIAGWAAEGAMFCYKNGIITGKTGNLFAPKDATTRAQAAAILHRFAAGD